MADQKLILLFSLCLVPHWVLNEYENHFNDSEKETNLSELIKTHFRGRVKIRLAGDLHHYTRHVPLTSNQLASGYGNAKSASNKPVLIVSGGGGAVSFVYLAGNTFHFNATFVELTAI